MNAEEGSLGSIETACAFSGVSSVGLCPKKGGGLRTYWNLAYLLECAWRSIMNKKWGGNRMKNFYGIIWGNTVRVLREREACENTVGLSMSDGPIETVKYIWLNI